jgi:hypothetical protein
MLKTIISKISDEIMDQWAGPSGLVWCKEKNEYVHPDKCPDCPECEAISIVDERPSKYLRPTDISW